jgi:hypothetical protein
VLKHALLALALLIALPYGWAPMFEFPEPAPFSGGHFLNPYDNLVPTWQRANLHAHGRAWGGLTSGRQPDDVVADTYRQMGYSVPGISDYHHIAAFDGVQTLPIYEHGYNIRKAHQLAIGARSVDWFDFPLWQSLSHRQLVINRVAATADLVALAHPNSRNAYSDEDLRALTGYQLLEVVNGTHRSEEPWDTALSSGRAVWALANDDTHDLDDPERTAVAWNMVNAATPSTADIVQALRSGRAYAVLSLRGRRATVDAALSDVQFSDGTLVVTTTGAPSTINFIGQGGALRKTVENTTTASYTFESRDTYIRPVIESPQVTILLNPVVRHDGVGPRTMAATVNTPATWLQRGLFALGLTLLLYVKRRARSTEAAPAVLRSANRRTA